MLKYICCYFKYIKEYFVAKIDYTSGNRTAEQVQTFFNDYSDDTIPKTGKVDLRSVAENVDETLLDILYFDYEHDSNASPTEEDLYYTGEFQTSWGISLMYVSDADLQAYAKDNNVDYQKVKDFITEVRTLDAEGREYYSFHIPKKSDVLSALNTQTINEDTIENFVSIFDDTDGIGVGEVTARDLNQFAQFYELNDAQIAKLVSLYSTTAKVKKLGSKTANDSIRDKIIAK
jgi:hypothetical protein